ncbi:hypothetical protein DFH27DRAFT_609922 [Peziza echinospora]|nr:hypothetical protein DFH27DRAFT_609922 [Peziza echinospora]
MPVLGDFSPHKYEKIVASLRRQAAQTSSAAPVARSFAIAERYALLSSSTARLFACFSRHGRKDNQGQDAQEPTTAEDLMPREQKKRPFKSPDRLPRVNEHNESQDVQNIPGHAPYIYDIRIQVYSHVPIEAISVMFENGTSPNYDGNGYNPQLPQYDEVQMSDEPTPGSFSPLRGTRHARPGGEPSTYVAREPVRDNRHDYPVGGRYKYFAGRIAGPYPCALVAARKRMTAKWVREQEAVQDFESLEVAEY